MGNGGGKTVAAPRREHRPIGNVITAWRSAPSVFAARETSRFAADSGVVGDFDSLGPAAGFWSPLRAGHHAVLYQFEAVEKTGDLLGATGMVVAGGAGVLIVGPYGLDVRRIGVGTVVDHQVAAGGQRVEQPAHDRLRVVGVGDMAEYAQHHQPDGLGEVERPGSPPQDPVGITYVGLDVVGGAFGAAGEQGSRVDQHEGVVFPVNHAALRVHPPAHLLRVVTVHL